MNTKEQFTIYSKKLSTIEYGKEGPTAIPLVENILNKSTIDWANPNLKMLDPCFGFGTFLYLSYLRLLKYHDETHILDNMLYGIEIEPFRYQLTRNKLKIKNLYLGDSLNPTNNIEEILMMDFDVIIGNPPYNGVNKQEKPWVDFYTKFQPMLKDNESVIVYVTPNAWRTRPESPKFQPISKMFLQNDLLYANLNVNSHFTNVGEDIGFQILRNSKTKNLKTLFEVGDNSFESKYIGQKIPLNNTEKIKFSIFDKIMSFSDKLKPHFSKRVADDAGAALRKGKFSKTQSNEYSIPVLYTLNQTYYTKEGPFELGKKVFLNYSGYLYKDGMIDKYMPILDGYVSGQATYSISVPNQLSAEIFRHNYTRKLILYYINNEKTGGFNTGIPNLPWLGYDKKYSDSDLYEMFGLTNEEIKKVESYVG